MLDEYKEHIRKTIGRDRELCLWTGLRSEALWYANDWEYHGHKSKWEAEREFREFVTATQIRTYCRRNKISTRKGSKHAFDCRVEHPLLWDVTRNTDMDGRADGVRWSWRSVDGLKNIYLWFE